MLRLRIVSPERVIFDGEVTGVRVPGSLGSFEILENHAPIISSLERGSVEYKTAEGTQKIDIDGGFVEVKQNKISLCVETMPNE